MKGIVAELESKIKSLSEDPGVYLMKDAGGLVLYVGKAKNLKNRVSSYFQDSKSKTPRIEMLVHKIADFETVLTDNEAEALILECNLIKRYKPKFNVQLRDDKSYPYVRVDLAHPFPRLEYARKARAEKSGVASQARYFGPFVSSGHLKDVLRWAQKNLELRDCSDAEFRNRVRPCILHQMHQCSAPCVGLISEKDYSAQVSRAIRLLEGRVKDVVGELKEQMEAASGKEDFERAALLRDRIRSIEAVSEQQKIHDPESHSNRDLIQMARGETEDGKASRAVVVVMAVRDGSVAGVLQFPFDDVDPGMPSGDFLFEFLAQYYLSRHESNAKLLPAEVLLPEEFESLLREQITVLERALAKSVEFRVPKRRESGAALELLEMVKKTAEHHLSEIATRVGHAMEDLSEVQRKLDLSRFPTRIECYDISHFQGEGTVASRVVFIDGRPEKSLYRHYHVQTVQGVDDFKSMREILGRRFENDHSLPNLVVIDGGKGQLSQVEAIFEELGVVGVDLVGLAKARTERDFTSAEVKSSMERVFKPGQKNPVMLKPGTGTHRVLTQARDEAHRFAITFHRQVRAKKRIGK